MQAAEGCGNGGLCIIVQLGEQWKYRHRTDISWSILQTLDYWLSQWPAIPPFTLFSTQAEIFGTIGECLPCQQ